MSKDDMKLVVRATKRTAEPALIQNGSDPGVFDAVKLKAETASRETQTRATTN